MGFENVNGQKVAVSSARMRSQNIDPPMLAVRANGSATVKVLAAGLLGVTGIWTPETSAAITNAASQIPADPNYKWTQDDAEKILAATGATPAPAHVCYWTLKGQAEVLLRSVPATFPGARPLTYPRGSKTPHLSLLSALREENIIVPEGMVLEVPVKLKLDAGTLVLAAPLRQGKLRQITEASESGAK